MNFKLDFKFSAVAITRGEAYVSHAYHQAHTHYKTHLLISHTYFILIPRPLNLGVSLRLSPYHYLFPESNE